MPNDLERLIVELAAQPEETEWIEFKRDYWKAEDVGEYISALANSAALHQQGSGFVLWGVADGDHQLVGTSLRPKSLKVGNEPAEAWLARLLHPRVDFRFHEIEAYRLRFVLLEVPAASHTPVRFKDFEYISVGTTRQKLRDHPEKERALWQQFQNAGFEDGVAKPSVAGVDVLEQLDTSAYFEMLGQRPLDQEPTLARLIEERFITPTGTRFDITNLGAILMARSLASFDRLARKALRIVTYVGTNRTEAQREIDGRAGYGAGFVRSLEQIEAQVPTNEHVEQALRRTVPMFPPLAIRELVANALIHQDFSVVGAGPMVEIFSDRIEVTNPGRPLIDTQRFLDAPPQSRNDKVGAFLRRVNVCEERGSGIDKVVTLAEVFQLPAPDFRVAPNHTVAIMFAPRPFRLMDRQDRIRACYQHAALQWVSNDYMTNATLRKRFGIARENSAQVSRVIRDALRAGVIKEYDPGNNSLRLRRYVPFWA